MGLGTCPHQKSASMGAWVWIPNTHMKHWAWWCMLVILVLELQTWIPGAHGSNTKSVSSCCRSDCLKKVSRNWERPGWPLVSSHKGLRFNHPQTFTHTYLTHTQAHTAYTHTYHSHRHTHTYSHKAYIYSHSTHTHAHTAFSETHTQGTHILTAWNSAVTQTHIQAYIHTHTALTDTHIAPTHT